MKWRKMENQKFYIPFHWENNDKWYVGGEV